jgi:hypothetical protein
MKILSTFAVALVAALSLATAQKPATPANTIVIRTGHLIHAERTDWMSRAKIVPQFGETQPFDRWGQAREIRGK